MRILIAADIFPPDIGGPSTYAEGLARALVERGHQVKVLCYQPLGVGGNVSSFEVKRINNAGAIPVKYWQYYRAAVRLARGVDIVYAMGPVNAGLPALKAAKKSGKPFVVKVVGDYAWEQAWVQKKSRESVEAFQTTKHVGKIGLLQTIERYVVRRSDKTIVPSEYLRVIVEGWGAKAAKVETIYNAMDVVGNTQHLSRAEAQHMIGISGDIVLSVGRLVPWKSNQMFVDLWQELLREHQQLKFVVVGDGPELPRMQERVRANGLDQSIFFVGKKSAQDLAAYYQSSSLFVLNSAYEGMSHVVLEAQAYHLPIIASDIGGNREVIEHGTNGLLVPYNDQRAWSEAIRKTLEALPSRDLTESGDVVLDSSLSFEKMIEKTETCINRLLRRR